jgi:hypothetical protein
VSVNAGVKPTGTTRFVLQGAFGPGLGRYIGGLASDAAFHRDGSITPIRTTAWAVQLSWLDREPWFRGTGPESASSFLFFAQVRYNLP